MSLQKSCTADRSVNHMRILKMLLRLLSLPLLVISLMVHVFLVLDYWPVIHRDQSGWLILHHRINCRLSHPRSSDYGLADGLHRLFLSSRSAYCRLAERKSIWNSRYCLCFFDWLISLPYTPPLCRFFRGGFFALYTSKAL